VLVTTVIALAHAFGMTAVAEGVETRSQPEFLARIGCDESQGYLHSRPLPKAELEPLLGRFSERTTSQREPGSAPHASNGTTTS